MIAQRRVALSKFLDEDVYTSVLARPRGPTAVLAYSYTRTGFPHANALTISRLLSIVLGTEGSLRLDVTEKSIFKQGISHPEPPVTES